MSLESIGKYLNTKGNDKMKKFTKIMAIVMAMLLTLSFTACGGEKGAIKKVITGYYNAMFEYDLEKAQEYINPESDQYDKIGSGISSSPLSQMGVQDEDMEDIMDDFKKLIKYKVKNIDIDGDTATATLEVKTPDFESINGNEMMNEYMEKKNIDRSDIKSGEDAKDLMKDVLKWMVNEKAPKLDKVTQTSEVTLDKVDGKWLISDMEKIDE